MKSCVRRVMVRFVDDQIDKCTHDGASELVLYRYLFYCANDSKINVNVNDENSKITVSAFISHFYTLFFLLSRRRIES